jgi:hypothetical protein
VPISRILQLNRDVGLLPIAVFLLLPLVLACAESPPQVVWQRSYGGTNADNNAGVLLTSDGQFVLTGNTFSGATGNKTSPKAGDYDGWVFGIDANGNKLWDFSYGGTNTDGLATIRQTTNGDFIAVAFSTSKASGNKTSTNYGSFDGWLIRFDTNGTKVWDKDFGGTGIDLLGNLLLTEDGGCIAGGGTWSAFSGNRTTTNYGVQDGWLLRLDSLGNTIWETNLGGAGFDAVARVRPTSDGGYILGNGSDSAPGATKTSANYGGTDFWIVKLNSSGIKEWEKSYGGTFSEDLDDVIPTADGGYIVGGDSSSGVSGNKTSTKFGGSDFWLIKLDSAGDKVWEKTFGGGTNDELETLLITSDGGYLLAGTSQSDVSGNKTSANYGGQDYWLVKTDADGNKLWEMSLGGTLDDGLDDVQPLAGGGYLLTGTSRSHVSGNKTVDTFGSADFWVVKLAVVPPDLAVVRSTNNVVLSWPSGTGDFVLQQNDNLATTNWSDVLVTPDDDGTNKRVTLPGDLQRDFFRLRGP